MALQTYDFGNLLASQKPDYSGLRDLVKNYYAGQEGAQEAAFRPQGLQSEIAQRLADTRNTEASTRLTGLQADYYPSLTEAQIQHYQDQAAGRTFAPSALGKLIQERNDIAAQDPDDPMLGEYDRVIKAQGGGKGYAPSALGKLVKELQEVEDGYLPNSNGQVPLDPEQQDELRRRYALQIQKNTTDSATRTTALRGQNLLKSINASNIDALTRYSGPKGALKLKAEQAKDLMGNPSEEYLQHLEAKQAADLEAKEVRQFFGDSITPDAQNAIYEMVNATSLTKSPEAAKRMIQKSRDTIKKQIDTFRGSLESTEAYGLSPNASSIGQQPRQEDYIADALTDVISMKIQDLNSRYPAANISIELLEKKAGKNKKKQQQWLEAYEKYLRGGK